MVNTGDFGVIRNVSLVRKIQTYYANVEKVRHFEESLEQNRATFVEAQQRAGLSPVDTTDALALAAQFSQSPELMAAAKNYWLYTNRHLKLMKSLRTEADALATKIRDAIAA